MRVLVLWLVLASAAAAQEPDFQFAQGPWRTDHELIGVLADGYVLGSIDGQLIASDDGGLSWTVREGVAVPLAIVEHEGELIGAFGAEGIRRSTDGARSWGAPEAVGGQVEQLASGGDALWAATQTAVFKYEDGRWADLSFPLETSERIGGVAVLDGVGGVSVWRGFDTGSVYAIRTLDGGGTWARRSIGVCSPSGVAVAGRELWYGRAGCDVNFIGYFSGGLYRWPEDAVSPREVTRGDVRSVVTTKGGTVVYATGSALVEAASGDTLTNLRAQPATLSLDGANPLLWTTTEVECGVDPPCYAAQVGGGIEVRVDDRWAQTGVLADETRQVLYLNGRLFASTDESIFEIVEETWEIPARSLLGVRTLADVPAIGPLALVDPSPVGGGLFPNAVDLEEPSTDVFINSFGLAIAQTETSVVVSFRGGFYSSGSEDGVTLCPIAEFYECEYDIDLRLPFDNVRTLHASGANVYAGASGPSNEWNYEPRPLPTPVWASGDGGQTWADDSEGLTDVSEAFAFASGEGEAWVGTDVGIFHRIDGQPWTLSLDTSERVYVLERDASGALLAGGEGGLWRLSETGWAPYGTGLSGRTVYDIALDETDGTLALATDRGVWATRPLVTVESEAAPPEAPAQLTLSAFPNPASGAVRITAVSPEAGPVRVRVFDVLGREVADLGSHASGATVTWTGAAPAGIYLVRAETATSTVTTQITRLR
ncbi:T9SS type A sorting domain-containing protein [Rubricoccus marinus]|uniref:Secretion system C-terminal sorting domain-containing protein n=1 Tax=Rubricoccus marinus TaxID=716817 RepID=A0A259TY63_9BACT|nr:T9SS type A sorting domain-containing protein [Rubricoccus marinus]OZC02630.1 hypothetical protein BSZ36_06365 [Rubricoccus marinus]